MTSKEKLQQAIAEAGGLKSIKVGCRLFVFTEGTRHLAMREADRYARRSGEMIYNPDGSRVFYKWSPIENVSASGSDRYEWHPDGNKVLQAFTKVTVINNAVDRCTVLKKSFRLLNVE